MQDPIDVFFDTGNFLDVPSGDDDGRPQKDNPAPMRAIEEQAISEDVDMVRTKLKSCIDNVAQKIPGLLELAMMMQEPAMVDSASKMVATLSKLSTDLIGIDLKVLQESKKVKELPKAAPAEPAEATPAGVEQTEMTTGDVIRLIRDQRRARESRRSEADPPIDAPVSED